MDEKPSREEKVENAANTIEGLVVTAFAAGVSYIGGTILTSSKTVDTNSTLVWIILAAFVVIVGYIFIH